MKNSRISLLLIAVLFFCLLSCPIARTRRVCTPAHAEEKVVYLTFDDGPSTVVTGRILDTLKKEKIKATFFIVSDRAETRKDTLKRIVAEGHTVGVHSATHKYADIYSSLESLRKDVGKCAEFIYKNTGVMPTVYRFPGGKMTEARRDMIRDMGYSCVGWNAACGDEEIPNASVSRLVEETKNSSRNKNKVILLLHDSAPRKNTAAALPEIIHYYRSNGFAFRAF